MAFPCADYYGSSAPGLSFSGRRGEPGSVFQADKTGSRVPAFNLWIGRWRALPLTIRDMGNEGLPHAFHEFEAVSRVKS